MVAKSMFSALFGIGCFCAAAMAWQPTGDMALSSGVKPVIKFGTSQHDRSCPAFKTIKADGTVELCT